MHPITGIACSRCVVFAEIPKTSTGRIQNFKLREMAKAA
jgi:3-(methylthio)propionyl---CoA ligase